MEVLEFVFEDVIRDVTIIASAATSDRVVVVVSCGVCSSCVRVECFLVILPSL